MTVCTFAGHREVWDVGIQAALDEEVEKLLEKEGQYVFYSGGMGQFDALCAAAVRRGKLRHPESDIKLVLVLPYMKQEINADKRYFEEIYDDIIVPEELMGVHYKQAIGKRNRWMVDRADVLFSYVYREFGGAYKTLRYAEKRKNLKIVSFASDK